MGSVHLYGPLPWQCSGVSRCSVMTCLWTFKRPSWLALGFELHNLAGTLVVELLKVLGIQTSPASSHLEFGKAMSLNPHFQTKGCFITHNICSEPWSQQVFPFLFVFKRNHSSFRTGKHLGCFPVLSCDPRRKLVNLNTPRNRYDSSLSTDTKHFSFLNFIFLTHSTYRFVEEMQINSPPALGQGAI